jgi:hypothetical protein
VRVDYDRPLIVIEGRLSMPAGPPASHSRPPRRLLRKVAEQIEDKTMRIGMVGGTGTLGGVAPAEFAWRGHAVGVLSRRAPEDLAVSAQRRVDRSIGDRPAEAVSDLKVFGCFERRAPRAGDTGGDGRRGRAAVGCGGTGGRWAARPDLGRWDRVCADVLLPGEAGATRLRCAGPLQVLRGGAVVEGADS